MATTATWGLRYPISSDNFQPHIDIKNLADDVDADLTTINAKFTGLQNWTTFTPTFRNNAISGTPTDIGKTVTRAGYWRIGTGAGSIIIAQAEITASAAASNGMSIGLPVTSAERWLVSGSLAVSAGSPPAGQSGMAYMAPSLDRLLCVTYTNAFLDCPSGATVRYLAIYKAAS